MDRNSEFGIEADATFEFRLLEYGRQRISTLKRLGFLDVLFEEDDPKPPEQAAVRAAFELGAAAAEHRFMAVFEDYVHDGMAVDEWRHAGLPKARAERIRQGKRTRRAIEKAAKELLIKEPLLIRNDTEMGRRILALGLPELDKGQGQQLGLDAITRHLRALRGHSSQPENG